MEQIYPVLAEHQVTESWRFQDLSKELHRWMEIYNVQCELDVPNISLCIDAVSPRCLGHYRLGHNGLGLLNEIAINTRFLLRSEFWDTLGTLLHEMLHAWQYEHGKPSGWYHHNREFRDKAKTIGLIVDRRGYTQYEPDGPFICLLRECGVRTPQIPQPEKHAAAGFPKLKEWSCGCKRGAWVAGDGEWKAKCLTCGQELVRASQR